MELDPSKLRASCITNAPNAPEAPPVTRTLRQPRASNKLHELQNSFGIVGRKWILPVWRLSVDCCDGCGGEAGMRPRKFMVALHLEKEKRRESSDDKQHHDDHHRGRLKRHTQCPDHRKTDMHFSPNAAYYIAFGPHGPRALPPPGEQKKVFAYTAAGVLLSFVIFATMRSFAKPAPSTMTKEWQEATNEFLKVRLSAAVCEKTDQLTTHKQNRPRSPTPSPVSPPRATTARATFSLPLPTHKFPTFPFVLRGRIFPRSLGYRPC